MKVNRWATLGAGCLVQASSGLNYSFSIIAPTLKDLLGFNDQTLALIAGSINLGGYFAIPSGRVYDALQHRHNLGPRLCIWIGCVLMALGYGGMWAQATNMINASVPRMLLCGVLAGNAGTWWDTAALVTNVRNFPDDRGSVLGICKAFLGLSTSIYASFYWALFATPPTPPSKLPANLHPGASSSALAWMSAATARVLSHAHDGLVGPVAFLAVLASIPSLLNLLGSLFINQVPSDYHEPDAAGQAMQAQLPYATVTVSSSDPQEQLQAPSGQLSGAPAAANTPAQPAAGNHAALVHVAPQEMQQHKHHHVVNKGARFMCLYMLITCIAVFQAASTLSGQGQVPGSELQKLHALLLLVLLCLLLLVPVSAGPLLRYSLRHGPAAGAPVGRRHWERSTAAPPGHKAQHEQPDVGVPLLQEAHDHDSGGSSSAILMPGATSQQEGAGRAGVRQQAADEPAACSCQAGEDDDEEDEDVNEAPPVQNLTAGMALQRATFWVLFLSLLSASASGLTLLNNMAPLVISLGGKKGGQVALVSLFSVANASGRLLFGHLSEYYLHQAGLPRPVFVILATGIVTVCMAALALGAPLATLAGLSLLTGLGFGGAWAAVPSVASDLFGLSSFASIYCILQCAPAGGVLFFASYLAGLNLQRYAPAEGGDCLGLECFAGTWRYLLALDLLTLCAGIWLWQHTRAAYARGHAAHTSR